MPYPIEKKFVIAVASSALFDLTESDSVFRQQGEDKYREYQEKNINVPFNKGVAYPFIKRLLSLNNSFSDIQPIEVVLMSKNSPETGERAFRSIEHYNLNISRACFTSGKNNFQYLPAFNATLFLSANSQDVKEALHNGYAAGRVLNRHYIDAGGNINTYFEHEKEYADKPLPKGPILDLLSKISYYQNLEKKMLEKDKSYQRILKTAIVTARNAPAHERVISSLKTWGINVDEAFFLGGIEKSRILSILKPHIFFDDQLGHLSHLRNIPAVHIPFGITNK